MDGHEGTLEALKYLDNSFFTFLNNLFKDNLFKETTVFLLSDHGTAVPSPYYITDFCKIERTLPKFIKFIMIEKTFFIANNINIIIKISKY